MLPNFDYGRQIMHADVKKQGLPQMSANRPSTWFTGMQHLPVKTHCFLQFGISCELGKRKKWDGRQTGGIYLWKANVLRSLEEDQQHAHWCFHNRVWRPKVVKTSENETVDEQNIQTLQHALCWTPQPPNLNVSARVLAKVMLGVWFFSSIGANALQVTIALNFGGEGVVPDRRVWIFRPSTVVNSKTFF